MKGRKKKINKYKYGGPVSCSNDILACWISFHGTLCLSLSRLSCTNKKIRLNIVLLWLKYPFTVKFTVYNCLRIFILDINKDIRNQENYNCDKLQTLDSSWQRLQPKISLQQGVLIRNLLRKWVHLTI